MEVQKLHLTQNLVVVYAVPCAHLSSVFKEIRLLLVECALVSQQLSIAAA